MRIPLLAGELVVEAKLGPEGETPGLVGRIPPGMRAVGVEVNEQTGVAGFVLPDHRVDVIQPRTDSSLGNDRSRGETILQNVLVLAAGQVSSRPDDKSIQVRTVTLAVTPTQAEILSAAKSKGAVTLALRGMEDKEVEEPEEPKVETAPVLVAARDLMPGEFLNESSTRVVDLPLAYLPSDRFANAGQVRERAVRVEIRAGEPILESKLRSLAPEPRQRTALSESIPHWTRAVSLSTKSFPHLASQIQVGDRVDVVVTIVDKPSEPANGGMAGLLLPAPSGGSRSAVAEKIIDNVLVIGETRSEARQAPVDGAITASEPAGASGEITLAVNVEDVELLEHAKASGTVSIALRHQEDHGIYQKGVTIPPSADYGLIHRGFGLPPEPYRIRVNPGRTIPGRRIPVTPPVSPGERMPPMAKDTPDRGGFVPGRVSPAGERSDWALGTEGNRTVLTDQK